MGACSSRPAVDEEKGVVGFGPAKGAETHTSPTPTLLQTSAIGAKKAMPDAAAKYLLVAPEVPAPLDSRFSPLILGKRKYLEATKSCVDTLDWALLRADGCARYSLPVFAADHPDVEASVYLAGVLIQEMMWQRSGHELLLCGPEKLCEALQTDFSAGGKYEFEAKSMPNVCGRPDEPFKVTVVRSTSELPEHKDTPQICGKDASGCRLAFDLGKSDIKTVAVRNNEVLHSKETEWDVTNPDPEYHYDRIMEAMKEAKESLPWVDAVGGSATGTISADNSATWCDIFPNVPPEVYSEKVVGIFRRLADELAPGAPLKVINDGEVTALAAVQKINAGNVLGISMGSSEGAGYANADGNLLGWINELCYVRLDMNPEAPTDPWTGGAHTGISHMYLGQRGATKLAAKAGIDVPPNYTYPHPEMCTIKHEGHAQCLKLIQKAMEDPDKKDEAQKIYETLGVYLGYALAQYSEFYKIDHVMILGRVSKGAGGDLMLNTAKKVLEKQFPEYAGIQFHTADDHFKGVGQCIAAAALPTLPSMPLAAAKYLVTSPSVPAPLDPKFSPLILGKRKYLEAAKDCQKKLEWALVRADGCARYTLPVFPAETADANASIYLAGVLIQEMLWQRSGCELKLCGPLGICQAIKADYSLGGRYEFEVKSMPNVCGTPSEPFKVSIVGSASELPEHKDTPQVCGKDATGCRLAFDLGKSDIKTVAVQDNQVVYSKETEWDVTNPDPEYHYNAILEAMKVAKEALPRVDAVGGSATGTISGNNSATWCDIFPNVPPDVYEEKVVGIFRRLADELAPGVPLKVINDGEVTALAAVQKINAGNVMGISMGSSEGAGYANENGNLLGWINELCYVRLDMNPDAPTDPWTEGAHTGISHMYLGQRGATKLAAQAGIEVPPNYAYPHPDMCTIKHEDHAQCLKLIQKAMAEPGKESEARKIYETLGVYLGYALAQYSEFYKIDHVMILGRVSKGVGGDLMLETAKKVLARDFPEYAGIQFHTADDHFKGVGQCIAAAALPTIPSKPGSHVQEESQPEAEDAGALKAADLIEANDPTPPGCFMFCAR